MPKQKSPSPVLIAKTMRVADIVALCPGSQDVLTEYGLHCTSCSFNALETLQEGCLGHGFEEQEIDELIEDLNEMMQSQPARPETLTVTKEAAQAIDSVAKEEGRTGEGLAVIVDESGGFCMEFREQPEKDEKVFRNADVPDVRIFANTLTLKRIGGSTIDFREGRFKLDLPSDDTANKACACGKGTCGCHK